MNKDRTISIINKESHGILKIDRSACFFGRYNGLGDISHYFLIAMIILGLFVDALAQSSGSESALEQKVDQGVVSLKNTTYTETDTDLGSRDADKDGSEEDKNLAQIEGIESPPYEKFYKHPRPIFMKGIPFTRPRLLTNDQIQIFENNLSTGKGSSRQVLQWKMRLSQSYFAKQNWKGIIRLLSPHTDKLHEAGLNLLLSAYLGLNQINPATSIAKILQSEKKIGPYSLIQIADAFAAKIRENKQRNSRVNEADQISEVVLFLKAGINNHPKSLALRERLMFFNEEFEEQFPTENMAILEGLVMKNKALGRHHSQICLYSFLTGYTEKALKHCQMAMDKDPSEVRTPLWYGKVLENSGFAKKGQRMIASVGQKFPDSPLALEASAHFFAEQENWKKAYPLFKKAISKNQPKPSAFLGLANTAMALGKFETALWAFQKNCHLTQTLPQDFRRAAGQLRTSPALNSRFKRAMETCKL